LIEDRELARELGSKGRETVRDKFLITRLLEQYLDLFNSFETRYILKKPGETELYLKTIPRKNGYIRKMPGVYPIQPPVPKNS
jgi:hypothetical protein